MKEKKFLFLLVVGVIVVLLLGCSGGSGSTSPDDAAPAIEPSNFQGAWYGSWGQTLPDSDPGNEDEAAEESFTVFIRQDGNSIRGTLLVPYFIIEEDIIGTVNGNILRFWLDDGETDPNQQMIFFAELNDSDFVGTISGPPIGDGYFNGYAISEGELIQVRTITPDSESAQALAYDGQFFWSDGFGLEKMDASGHVVESFGQFCYAPFAFGAGSLWATDLYREKILHIDENGTIVDTIEPEGVDWSISGLAHDGTSLYMQIGETISLLNENGTIQNQYIVPGYAELLTYGGGSFWTYCAFTHYIYEMDAQCKVLTVFRNLPDAMQTSETGFFAGGIAVDATSLYVTTGIEIEVLQY